MKATLAPLFIVSIIFVAACGQVEKPQDNANNKKALEEIKKESKVTGAIIPDANVLYVSIKDDGSRGDGYAQYLCSILSENKATIKWVKVVQEGTAGQSGSHRCDLFYFPSL